MKRKDFLEKLGLGAAFVLTSSCLGGCGKNESLAPVDLSLNLTDPEYVNLLENGGYSIIENRVVIARTTTGEYVAATLICSHENKKKIILKDDEWFCTDHDARFDLIGDGLNEKGSKGLTIYTTELNGDILKVFS